MAKIIRLIGQKRGGTYIISKWFENQFKANGYDTRSFVEINPKKINEDLTFYTSKTANVDKNDKRCLIYTINDFNPSDIPSLDENIENAYEIYNVIYLRDAFNLYASRLESNHKINVNNHLSLAYESQNSTKFFNNKTFLNFNLWIQNKDYRQSILNYFNLSINEDDDAYDLSKTSASGSSFNERNTPPTVEDLLTRWKNYISNPNYIKIFANEELKRITSEIFGSTFDMPTI